MLKARSAQGLSLVRYVVKLAEFRLEIAEVWGGSWKACGAFDQVVWLVLLPVAVDVLPQPTEERTELAALHFGSSFDGGLEELDGEHVTDGVGREVTKVPDGPVGVLQNAERVVLGNDIQILIHLRVPRFGEVGDGESVLEEIHLQLESQENVKVVGELVSASVLISDSLTALTAL
jgi:hypothetical protein